MSKKPPYQPTLLQYSLAVAKKARQPCIPSQTPDIENTSESPAGSESSLSDSENDTNRSKQPSGAVETAFNEDEDEQKKQRQFAKWITHKDSIDCTGTSPFALSVELAQVTSQSDQAGILKNRQNQVKAVHYIAKRNHPVTEFKHICDLLNSVDNAAFVTDSTESNKPLFWKVATILDDYYLLKRTSQIAHRTPHTFARLLTDKGLPQKKLSRPIQTRWSTCRTVIHDVIQYNSVISAVLTPTEDAETQRLSTLFSTPTATHLLAGQLYVLNMAQELNTLLQKSHITIPQSLSVITQFQEKLLSIEDHQLKNHIQALLDQFAIPVHEQSLADTVVQTAQIISSLVDSLGRRFSETNECSSLDFINHDMLTSPNTLVSDTFIQHLGDHRTHTF
ncbi:hypothetical protein BLNAU_18920 [Blattamonas nauphoetae]|uniref:Uncharacterized protein n=1 Tax=Blattamonas nauphoetae TaxID=2049346 RepID=A0ABQ9X340_9EUKA|nr:hypothetical protein BLNAU_18920 [Blattamonas nauphoetae]